MYGCTVEAVERKKVNIMKKYVVICYSVHNKEIASHDVFENKDDAYAFLKKTHKILMKKK